MCKIWVPPHWEFGILTLTLAFHHTFIGYHNLEIVYNMDIKMGFSCLYLMNKIVGATIID